MNETNSPITDAMYVSGEYRIEVVFDHARRLERERIALIAALELMIRDAEIYAKTSALVAARDVLARVVQP